MPALAFDERELQLYLSEEIHLHLQQVKRKHLKWMKNKKEMRDEQDAPETCRDEEGERNGNERSVIYTTRVPTHY